ncbi:hypothetical protein TrVE_jg5586 [Triparma verrucosa]|uniref:WW domain-containing protein n=1 Tax=Triparma verrucosa TaxID=1606542 RepID=A0A9W7EMI4_9STRA|nr:hypothetical protein TrVE_jg5586 [Triparma verrucosa]
MTTTAAPEKGKKNHGKSHIARAGAATPQQNILGRSPPPPPPPTPTPTPPPKPDPWISATDANGKLYYINRETNETVWERP